MVTHELPYFKPVLNPTVADGYVLMIRIPGRLIMPLPRTIDIDGRRYAWRDLVALRRTQATPRAEQPTLFALREDHRPPGERSAAERYEAPSLFARLNRPE